MIDRGSRTDTYNTYKLHVSELFPEPYPRYPILINRFMDPQTAHTIELKYGVSNVPPTGLDRNDDPLNYKRLALKVSRAGRYGLSPLEDAFVQFVNVLYFYCYEKYHHGDELELTWKVRHTRGTMVRNIEENVMRGESLDRGQVDDILERALQRSDIETIRAVLNYEGYGIPVNEPNELVIPVGWDKERDFSEIEFKITPEEWDAPLEAFDAEPSLEESAVHKAFAKTMAENIPLRLERLLRQRDIGMLRMMLRLYGHNILPNTPSVQDVPEQSR